VRQIQPPLVVGHRGASAEYPENTLAAFEGAIEAGADVVELDVRLTSDGVPVVMHDADVAETTDGAGFVHTFTLDGLKRLNASRNGPRTEVPTLHEALQLLTGRVGVNVEVKNLPGEPAFDSPREEAVERTLALLDEIGFVGSVLISSFNWLCIERVRELSPQTPTGFLSSPLIDARASLVYARSAGHSHVLPHAAAVFAAGEGFVDEAHRDGIQVGTWTVDEVDAMERLFAMGVDALATNRPDVAVGVRDRFRAARSP
jgi:glycerophosphoryl diester phosphodiesterase